jgi:hypothetical protein
MTQQPTASARTTPVTLMTPDAATPSSNMRTIPITFTMATLTDRTKATGTSVQVEVMATYPARRSLPRDPWQPL